MIKDVFPEVYSEELEKQKEEKEKEINEVYNNKKNGIENVYNTSLNSIFEERANKVFTLEDKKKKIGTSGIVTNIPNIIIPTVWILSCVGYIVACFGRMEAAEDPMGDVGGFFFMLLGGGPFIGLIVMLICIIVEFFVKIIIKFGIKKEIKREEAITNQRENELMDEHSQELAEVMMSKNSEIVNFEKEQKIEYYKYLEDFNKNVQKGIIECASSKNAIEVAEWLTKEYSKIITERLKENDTEKQEVTFSFKVYSDYINCSMGNYTLSEKLEGQSKQEALAKCIEANVKFNIMQKYPQLNVAESSYSNDMLSYKSTLIYTL